MEDGWHNKRCDDEIFRYKDKQSKAKRSAEARWSKPKAHSDGNADASLNAMRTHSDGNAHQTPDTRHQTPDITLNTVSNNSTEVGPGSENAARPSPGEISKTMRQHGIQSQPGNPMLLALCEQGVALETIAAACDEAKRSKPGESIGLTYVVRIIERWAKEASEIAVSGASQPKKSIEPDWSHSNAGIDAKGREMGIQARPTESYADYKARIFEAIRNKKDGQK